MPSQRHDQGRNRSNSVRRALMLLEAVADANQAGDEPLASQLACQLEMNRSTALRLLQPLVDHNLVEQENGAGGYRLGPAVVRLGQAYLEKMEVRRAAGPYLRSLRDLSHETVHLGIKDDLEVVYVDKVESLLPVRMYSVIGARQPLYCTAMGKAHLAHAPESVFRAVVDRGLVARTANTIVSAASLRQSIAEIRDRGFAVDDIENEPDIRCVAAPIFDHLGGVVAMVSISGPATRMTPDRVAELGPEVRDATRAISHLLGYQGASVP